MHNSESEKQSIEGRNAYAHHNKRLPKAWPEISCLQWKYQCQRYRIGVRNKCDHIKQSLGT